MRSKKAGRVRGRTSGIALAALAVAAFAGPAIAKVGVASVVNGEPLSKPPQDAQRVLHIGNEMLADETVSTKDRDRAHLVFLDGSTLTIGPNSSVVIDKFVFDPAKQNGTLNISAGRGVLRYVGGAISKNSEVTIKTPSATVGIRGGIATVAIEPSGATRANFLFGGSLSITSQGVTHTTTQPSTQVAALTGMPPTPPAPIPPGTLDQTNRALSAAPGTGPGTGPGASGPASSPTAVAISSVLSGSSFSQSNSATPPAAARAAIATTQQAQLGVGKALAAAAAATTSSQAAATPGAGPLQASGPLQGGAPLQASGPMQGTGPLQNAGPLAATTPLQQTGPIATNAALSIGAAQPNLATPNMPVQAAALGAVPALATGLVVGDGTALAQLQNLLATPQGSSPATLATLVSGITTAAAATSTTPAASVASSPSGGGFGGGAPSPMAPTVYNNTASATLSPN